MVAWVKSLPVVLVGLHLLALTAGAQITLLFEGTGAENGVTEPGAREFSFMGSTWSGGIVRTERIPALYASGSFSYEIGSGGGAVVLTPPSGSVRFFYVHGFGFAAGTATARNDAGDVIGMASSLQASFFGAPGNFVSIEPAEPIARIDFSAGVIDNFTFQAAQAAPTATATELPTSTATAISTATATAPPTETSAPQACTGDCDGDGSVTVDEVVRGVNIALGTLAVTECQAFDQNADTLVTVDEIVAAVNRALNGCGAA